jgi:hypothetical protein
MFTSTLPRSLLWARSIQSIAHHAISLIPNLLFSFHWLLDRPNGLFPSGFPSVTYMNSSALIRVTCPACLILLYLTHYKQAWRRVKFAELPQYAAFSNLSSLILSLVQIFSSSLFLNILNLCSPYIRDQVTHPYKTKEKIIGLPTWLQLPSRLCLHDVEHERVSFAGRCVQKRISQRLHTRILD